MPIGENLDEASLRVGAVLIERGFIAAGATCVFVSISPDMTRRDANYLRIHQV